MQSINLAIAKILSNFYRISTDTRPFFLVSIACSLTQNSRSESMTQSQTFRRNPTVQYNTCSVLLVEGVLSREWRKINPFSSITYGEKFQKESSLFSWKPCLKTWCQPCPTVCLNPITVIYSVTPTVTDSINKLEVCTTFHGSFSFSLQLRIQNKDP